MFARTKVAAIAATAGHFAVLAVVFMALSTALFTTLGTEAARAQVRSSTQPSANAVKLAREILDLKDSRFMYEPMVPGVIERVRSMLLQTNPTLGKDLEVVAASLRKTFAPRATELLNSIATLYASRFSEAELKEIAAFYRSPVGKKVIEFEPRIFDEALDGLKGWQEKFAEEVIRRFRAEMKKRGHDL